MARYVNLVLKKRLDEKVQKAEAPVGRKFMYLARDLGLGVADLEKINLKKLTLS